MKRRTLQSTRESLIVVFSRRSVLACMFGISVFFQLGCSVFSSRPVQEMSYTQSALRAAKEVQADTLAPELYRQAVEWFFRAKHEFKFKNFKVAKDCADKARYFAEQAEFESVRNGGNRADSGVPEDRGSGNNSPEKGSTATPPSSNYPTPEGTPADVYEQRKAEEKAAAAPPPVTTPPGGPVNPSVPGMPVGPGVK